MQLLQTTLALVLTSLSALSSAATWNAANDFATNANPNGVWSYGYYPLYGALGIDLPSGDLPFIQLTSSTSGQDYATWFTPPEVSALSILRFRNDGNLIMIAGFAPAATFYAPVVRWTAPLSGDYHVDVTLSYYGLGAATTTTSQVGIRNSNTVLDQAYIGGPADLLNVDRTLTLAEGQYIDFFVAKGQHAISLTGVVSSIPEPNVATLLIIGTTLIARRLLTRPQRPPPSQPLRGGI